MSEFSDGELRALAVLVRHAAKNCGGGEDTIGAIMYTGAFHQLPDPDEAVVALARKIDAHLPYRRSVSIVAKRNGQVLVVSSRKWGGFSLPGGKIDPGETPDQAAVREFREETGCEIVDLKPLGEIEHNPVAQDPDRNKWLCRCYVADIGDQEPRQNEDGTIPRWATPDEIRESSLYRSLTVRILEWAGL